MEKECIIYLPLSLFTEAQVKWQRAETQKHNDYATNWNDLE